MIGWLANSLSLTSLLIRTRSSKSNFFVFMLRWPTFLTASIVHTKYKALDLCGNMMRVELCWPVLLLCWTRVVKLQFNVCFVLFFFSE